MTAGGRGTILRAAGEAEARTIAADVAFELGLYTVVRYRAGLGWHVFAIAYA